MHRRLASASAGALLWILTCASCGALGFNRQVEVEEAPVLTTSGGVEVQDLRLGKGDPARPGARVRFHYTGRVEGGEVFDTSYDRGQPEELVLGSGVGLAGLHEGLLGMARKGLRRLRVPPHLAYGAQGIEGLVPPDALLVLEVELLEVVNP